MLLMMLVIPANAILHAGSYVSDAIISDIAHRYLAMGTFL